MICRSRVFYIYLGIAVFHTHVLYRSVLNLMHALIEVCSLYVVQKNTSDARSQMEDVVETHPCRLRAIRGHGIVVDPQDEKYYTAVPLKTVATTALRHAFLRRRGRRAISSCGQSSSQQLWMARRPLRPRQACRRAVVHGQTAEQQQYVRAFCTCLVWVENLVKPWLRPWCAPWSFQLTQSTPCKTLTLLPNKTACCL